MSILIDTWHPIDGKWRHIVQTEHGENTTMKKYFTDGESVAIVAAETFGKMLKIEPNEIAFCHRTNRPTIPAQPIQK